MKAVNIIGLVLVVVFFFVIGVYVNEVSSARWDDYSFDSYSLFSSRAADLTMEAASIMLVFVLFFIGAMIGNLVKVKTTTSKVMAIIGLSFSLLILLVTFVVLSSPSSLTFDESGGFHIIYGVICLAFFIVFLVQSVTYQKRSKLKPNSQVLDDDMS